MQHWLDGAMWRDEAVQYHQLNHLGECTRFYRGVGQMNACLSPLDASYQQLYWQVGRGCKVLCVWQREGVRLPGLPGGAIILCHFWKSVVLRQSRGGSAYALCLDISSCIGSSITHSCTKTFSHQQLRWATLTSNIADFDSATTVFNLKINHHYISWMVS